MNHDKAHAMNMLRLTSRTFYIPISRLVPPLQEAVASAYLCMRAIDEIEDHADLPSHLKKELLHQIRNLFVKPMGHTELDGLLLPYKNILPQVTMELEKWLELCPESAKPIVIRYVSRMAEQMGDWTHRNWLIQTEEDLDAYTYSVAGMVGELLTELWAWHDATVADMSKAVAYGRGLQTVNIIRNRIEDGLRGIDFFPTDWGLLDMIHYAEKNLLIAREYVDELPVGPALDFCCLPLALAEATIRVVKSGGEKLSRENVMEIVNSSISKRVEAEDIGLLSPK